MKTKYLITIILILFTYKVNSQITINSTSGNLAIGDVTDPSIFKIYMKNGNASMLGCSSDGLGDHLLRMFSTSTFLSLGINSYNLQGGQLITRLGVNYDINGSDGVTPYARVGSLFAPFVELNAMDGSIRLYGENGTLGSDFRSPNNNMGIVVTGSGRVGIGGSASSSYLLTVNGNAYSTGSWLGSDSKLKRNIKAINKSKIDSLFLLNAKSYQFKIPQTTTANVVNDSGRSGALSPVTNVGDYNRQQFGYIAEELEKVYPNLVITDSNGYKAVNYIALIPLIIEAMKTQQSQIDSLKLLVNKKSSLKSATSQADTTVITTKSNGLTITDKATLSQNSPNPFSQSTLISYYLPNSVQNATIYVYDMNGVQIKSYPIVSKGNGSITIAGYEFKPGIYLYMLLYDSQATETKRMILTQ